MSELEHDLSTELETPLGEVNGTEPSHKWIEVLVDCPGAVGLYTYHVPDDLAVSAGDIVSVPFGAQQVGAIAINPLQKTPEGLIPSSIKSIESVIKSAFFTKEYWQLLIRVGRYYQTPFIRIIRTALPPGLLSKSQRRIRLLKTVKNGTNISTNQTKQIKAVSTLSQELLETLKRSPQGDYSWQYLQRQLRQYQKKSVSTTSSPTQALRQLIHQGQVESYLATPNAPRAQKRQAVILLRDAHEPPATTTASATELTMRQREIVTALRREGGELWLSDALQLLHTTTQTLRKIAALGYIAIEAKEQLRVGSHSSALPDRPKSLTADQASALKVLHKMTGYGEALLHGVTGSGKTEVYLQAIAPILASQKSALVLVPEIGLTPQLTDRFRSRFGEQVCVYHSGLSEGERYDTWRQMLTGTPQVVIGTRSAIFAPLPSLGIIILDEEHDSSFKQDRPMPCYHARQVARWRAELESCPLILGSATPSLETWTRFQPESLSLSCQEIEGETEGQTTLDELPKEPSSDLPSDPSAALHYLCLPTRVHARPLPPIEIIDMRKELHEGNRTIFSRPLQTALENLVEKGQQGILFIHRRGHSSFVSCRSCGHVMECPNCDVSLSFHQTHAEANAKLRCHYCGCSQSHPDQCPECLSPYLKKFGSGTQRIVNDLAKYLPQARCLRFDSDTTRNKGAHRALLTRFAQGEADLLVGTQMLTKGIDLPQVTLVGVIAADGLLFMPDYRASERAFQTMMQVAGRAGRGEQPGRVIIQTYTPEHTAIEALVPSTEGKDTEGKDTEGRDTKKKDKLPQTTEQYGEFLAQEMSDRAALNYPPFGKLILLRLSGLEEGSTERAAVRLAHKLDTDPQYRGNYDILGPVPAPIYRVARRYRWHILLKLSAGAIAPNLARLRSPKGIRLTIDVDPLNLT
ncbi:MAG: primosomal protein N' [Cyanobacteria bacterium J06554_3]